MLGNPWPRFTAPYFIAIGENSESRAVRDKHVARRKERTVPHSWTERFQPFSLNESKRTDLQILVLK